MLSNAQGAAILAGTVTTGTFCGPPIILIGDNLTTTADPRWVAVAAFAGNVGGLVGKTAPLIGLDPLSAGYAADLATLLAAMQAFSVFFDVNLAGPFLWSDGKGLYSNIPPCGPIITIDSPTADPFAEVALKAAWAVSKSYLRSNARHLYGIGLLACGGAVPETQPSPPIYPLPSDTYADTLASLLTLWRESGASSAASITALQSLETDPTRLGISRRTHPALVPFIQLTDPNILPP